MTTNYAGAASSGITAPFTCLRGLPGGGFLAGSEEVPREMGSDGRDMDGHSDAGYGIREPAHPAAGFGDEFSPPVCDGPPCHQEICLTERDRGVP